MGFMHVWPVAEPKGLNPYVLGAMRLSRLPLRAPLSPLNVALLEVPAAIRRTAPGRQDTTAQGT